MAAFYDGVAAGCAALERVLGNGIAVAALEYLDGGDGRDAGALLPGRGAGRRGMHGARRGRRSREEAARLAAEAADVLGEDAIARLRARRRGGRSRRSGAGATACRWRVRRQRGGKVSEDIVVPLDRLAEAIEETLEIGARHGLETCSWGHAGDGNLHSTFMIAPGDDDELRAGGRGVRASCSRSRCGSAARSPASTASAG